MLGNCIEDIIEVVTMVNKRVVVLEQIHNYLESKPNC